MNTEVPRAKNRVSPSSRTPRLPMTLTNQMPATSMAMPTAPMALTSSWATSQVTSKVSRGAAPRAIGIDLTQIAGAIAARQEEIVTEMQDTGGQGIGNAG